MNTTIFYMGLLWNLRLNSFFLSKFDSNTAKIIITFVSWNAHLSLLYNSLTRERIFLIITILSVNFSHNSCSGLERALNNLRVDVYFLNRLSTHLHFYGTGYSYLSYLVDIGCCWGTIHTNNIILFGCVIWNFIIFNVAPLVNNFWVLHYFDSLALVIFRILLLNVLCNPYCVSLW